MLSFLAKELFWPPDLSFSPVHWFFGRHKVSPAFQWAQNDTSIFLTIKRGCLVVSDWRFLLFVERTLLHQCYKHRLVHRLTVNIVESISKWAYHVHVPKFETVRQTQTLLCMLGRQHLAWTLVATNFANGTSDDAARWLISEYLVKSQNDFVRDGMIVALESFVQYELTFQIKPKCKLTYIVSWWKASISCIQCSFAFLLSQLEPGYQYAPCRAPSRRAWRHLMRFPSAAVFLRWVSWRLWQRAGWSRLILAFACFSVAYFLAIVLMVLDGVFDYVEGFHMFLVHLRRIWVIEQHLQEDLEPRLLSGSLAVFFFVFLQMFSQRLIGLWSRFSCFWFRFGASFAETH